MTEKIIESIKSKYHPLTLIVYGSYADGSQNAHSDFDALAVADCPACHDVSFVEGVQLDLFVYPPSHFQGAVDCDEILQIFDGQVLVDTNGLGAGLKAQVLAYMDQLPVKTPAEAAQGAEGGQKMLLRTRRGDPEGLFRWHWLLTESLSIFCDLMGQPYLGPKKTLRRMREQHPEAFACYSKALETFEASTLEAWVLLLKSTKESTLI